MAIPIKLAMSDHPATVRYKDDLLPAYVRMRRENYRHMPVIDDAGELVGVISDRDFQRAMWAGSPFDAHGLPEMPNFRKDAKVSDYMTWPAISCSEETSLQVAINTMIEKKISAIVVLRDDKLVGILTHEDLLRVLANLMKGSPAMPGFAYSWPLSKVAEMLSAAGI